MERIDLLNRVLKPVDRVMDLSLVALRRANLYEPFKKGLYDTTRLMLNAQFKLTNNLKVYGAENVPRQGGVILAMNHQSWLDVEVIVAASPRKVSFLAKSEFTNWPLLHHVIELADGVYIRRGGDDETLETIADRLREGACIGIFPEGTIPGEEDQPRWEVERDTGLLRGKTGAVRLALHAGVPIVPVGISGTGKALPPEAFPRLQKLPLVKPAPVEVRFGEPIRLKVRAEEEVSYEQLRGMTDRVMRAISHLVDHSMGYEPMTLPIERKTAPSKIPPTPFKNKPLGEKRRVGVLVLHGFTSHISCVSNLRFPLEEMGLPYRIPLLRGHGTRWEDMEGVTSADWFEDAENSMLDLMSECRKVIVVGLSMGGLLALDLAARWRREVVGVVTIAAALKFRDPLSRVSPLIAKFVKSWPSPNTYNDPELEKQRNRNYPRFPTSAFVSLYMYSKAVKNVLSFVIADALIIHSRKDRVILPKSAEIIHNRISSKNKRLVWFEESGHEMLLDLEADKVTAVVGDFIREVMSRKSEARQ